MGVPGPADEAHDPDDLRAVGVRDGRRRKRHPGQRLDEVLAAVDHRCEVPCERGADRVGAGVVPAVDGAGRDVDAVELRPEAWLGYPSVNDVTPLVGQQDAHAGVGEIVSQLIEDRPGGSLQAFPRVLVGS